MRGRRLHEALHGPELPEEARQEPHRGGAAAVPPIQGPGQRRQAQLVPVLLPVLVNGGGCGGGNGAASAAAADAAKLGRGGDHRGRREAAGAADADQLGAFLVVLGDDARRGTAVGRDVRLGRDVGLARSSAVESDRASGATAAPAAAREEELGWRQR